MPTQANEGFGVSRGPRIRIWRPLTVWVVVTTGAIATTRTVPGAWSEMGDAATYDRVLALLVAACSTGLALALGWLWVITTTTVTGLLAGRPGPRDGATRRLVLLACGVAVVAGTVTVTPALAAGGDGRELLAGLTLPERAVAPPPPPARQTRQTPQARHRPTYVVRPGDSLWSIAHDHPDPDYDAASVDQRWRAIWLANREVVGDDPDLIIPGQALRLPTTQDPNSDGDR